MIKYVKISDTRSDETADYALELDKKYTVSTLLEEILKNKTEWGRLLINNYLGEEICFYKYGRQIGNIPEEYKNLEIKEVKASGGWTMMDYYIKFKK